MDKTIYLLCNMEKRTNFSDFEKQVLINLMKEPFSAILKTKVTNAVVNRQKQAAWDHLTKLYNATPNVSKRSVKQLVNFYRNMKKKARQNLAERKLERLRTIGNIISIIPPPPPLTSLAAVESSETPSESTDDSCRQEETEPTELPPIKLEEPEESHMFEECANVLNSITDTNDALPISIAHSSSVEDRQFLSVSNNAAGTTTTTLMEASDYEIKLQNEDHEHLMRQKQAKHEQLLRYREAEHEQMMKHREAEHVQLLKHKEADHDQLLKHKDAEYEQLLRHREAKYKQLLKQREAEYEQILKHKKGEYKHMKHRDQEVGMSKTEEKHNVLLQREESSKGDQDLLEGF